MGNIQREVVPLNWKSRRCKALQAVKRISMHQPAMPQWRKSFESGMRSFLFWGFREVIFVLMEIV